MSGIEMSAIAYSVSGWTAGNCLWIASERVLQQDGSTDASFEFTGLTVEFINSPDEAEEEGI
jgi:hypothetical protein